MLKIIENNDNFIVINKPHGIEFHGESGLFAQLKEQLGVDLYAVHRLDKETSGLIIFAKNSATASYFGRLFMSKSISKTYLALTSKKPKKKQGWVKGDIVKSRNGSYMLSRGVESPSSTYFRQVNLFENNIRLFVLFPKTGKTHQLRVVMKSLGSPIIGDSRYKGEVSDRMYLHAFRLIFEFNDKNYDIKALPDFGKIFSTINFDYNFDEK